LLIAEETKAREVGIPPFVVDIHNGVVVDGGLRIQRCKIQRHGLLARDALVRRRRGR
jgi:hypothetical protein